MEIQQTVAFQQYIKSLGWKSHSIDGIFIQTKRFPLLFSIAKIYRFKKLPNLQKTITYLQSEHIKTVVVEPDVGINEKKFNDWTRELNKYFTINTSPYLPTQTIRVDLTDSEETIFQKFTEAKRRAVRRAQKNNIIIHESQNIHELIQIKNKSAGLFGFITTQGIDKLWSFFAPHNAAILLAHILEKNEVPTLHNCIGGVLLLYWDKVAYYWIAGATKKGKKLFAPTLLVWEALKLAKQKGCTAFDFVGVWDERLPQNFNSWKGFTKFKEGFGGKELYYPLVTK